MSFLQLAKKLFEPVSKMRITYYKGVLQASSFFIFDIYTVYIFKIVGDALQSGDSEGLKNIIIRYGIVFIVFYFWKYFVRHRGRGAGKPTLSKILRDEVLKKFYVLNQSEVEKKGTGTVLSILQSGVQNWTNALMDIQYSGTEFIIKFIFALYIVYEIGTIYLLGFIVYIVVGQLIMNFLNNKSIEWRNKRKQQEILLSRNIVRSIMSKREILTSNKSSFERTGIRGIVNNVLKYNIKVNHNLFFMFNIPILLVQGFLLIALIQIYFSFINGNFSFGTFSALIAMSGYLVPLMLTSTNVFKNLTANYTHIEKMRNLLEETPKDEGYDTGSPFNYTSGTIKLKSISYGYTDDPVFSNFSLTLKGGKKTALVGASGSGKSTLVKLIAGYLRPDSGAVIVDGQDLSDISLKSYYKHIGYLTQEPSVFDGTVRENLLYAVEGRAKDISPELHQAVKLANCEFIYDLPKGLDTEIGERGIRLSGGQRQRLAIAKIFLKNPEIIILDEPTSALDSFSEEAITKAMHNLFENRTVIIIAHRLQTVKGADEIILLGKVKESEEERIENKEKENKQVVIQSETQGSEGSQKGMSKDFLIPQSDDVGSQVIERGTHDELVAKGGQYAKMLELQSGF